MPKLKKRKPSQPSSQDETLKHQSSVPTPEIEVSLVDRMKRRFSARNPSASEHSVSDGEPSTASSQDSAVKETGSKRKTSKSNLAKKVTQIDKYFSPDVGSKRLFQSPTRFPVRSTLTSPNSEERLDDEEQMSENQNTTAPLEKDTNNSDNPEEDLGSASSNERNTDKDSDESPKTSLKRKEDTQTSNHAKKRRSHSGPSRSMADDGDETGGQPEGGRSEDMLEQSQQEQETRKVSKKKNVKKKDSVILASGEVDAHMADKEFISSQVRAMSTPFILESGPRSWMNAWKAQQSSYNDELPDIPSSVIDRIVTKINFTMEDVYQRQLGRQQQRMTLMSLDELRKEPEVDSQSSLKPSLRDQASLQEVISSYPSEWPGRVGEEDQEMAERYASLRARMFALSRSESLSNQQRDQYKSLLGVLKMIHTNLEKYCSSQDLQKEVKRSKDLIFKITEKLQSGTVVEGQSASQREGAIDQPPASITNHSALVKTLFKAALSSDSS